VCNVGWSWDGIGGIPVGTWFDHEVDYVSVFDAVFFEEFVIGEGFSFEKKSLCVCGRSRGMGTGELRFKSVNGVRGVDRKGIGRRWFDRFESDVYTASRG